MSGVVRARIPVVWMGVFTVAVLGLGAGPLTPAVASTVPATPSNVWLQSGKLSPANAAEANEHANAEHSDVHFGASLDADDGLMVTGTSPHANRRCCDWAYIYEQGPDGWTETAKLDDHDETDIGKEAPDGHRMDGFGWDVAADAATRTVAVSDPGYDVQRITNNGTIVNETQAGAVHIYRETPNGSWTRSKLICCPTVDGDEDELFGIHDYTPGFGNAIDLDGDTLVVGSEDFDWARGRVWIYERASWGEWERVATFDGPDASGLRGSNFGVSVAAHQETVAVGASRGMTNEGAHGAVYVYQRGPIGWTQVDHLLPPRPGNLTWLHPGSSTKQASFGHAVDLHGDTLVVTDPQPERSIPRKYDPRTYGIGNKAYVYERAEDASWGLEATLDAKGPVPEFSPHLGWDVALSPDENRVVVSADNGDPDELMIGSAYVFERAGSGWEQLDRLASPENSPFDLFGYAVASTMDGVLVGAPYDDNSGDGAPPPIDDHGGYPHSAGGHGVGSVYWFEPVSARSDPAGGAMVAVGTP